MSENESELVTRAVAGDESALAMLLERYGPLVRKSLEIERKWQSLISHDDVMQDSYVAVWRGIGQFEHNGHGSFLRWLNRIARNKLRDAIERESAAKRPPPITQAPDDASCQRLWALVASPIGRPSHFARSRERMHVLNVAIAQLPPDYRTVVRLSDLKGLSGRDVAAAMGRNRGAVVMLRARALRRLRELLGSGSRFQSR